MTVDATVVLQKMINACCHYEHEPLSCHMVSIASQDIEADTMSTAIEFDVLEGS